MDRRAAQGGLTGRSLPHGSLVFAAAGRADEPDIRRLLRENALGGRIALSLEREPDAFAADFGLSRSHAFIIARDRATGAAIGLCERSVRDAFVDGEVCGLPYLGALRIAPGYRHRIAVLEGGFAAVRALLDDPADLPFALTSITADNAAARRLLGAGLPGLPTYRPVGELTTFALRTVARPSAPDIEPATTADLAAIAVLLQRVYRRYQFAPVWRASDLERLIATGALRIDDFLIVRRGPGVRACLAVWDQRATKQTVVRGYPPWLRRLRPLLNLAAPLAALPHLPPVGAALREAYLSHVAVEDEDVGVFRALLRSGLAQAQRRGCALALIGLAPTHPFAAPVAQHGVIRYRTLLHLVSWPDAPMRSDARAPRLPHPEIAVM
ncbi:MAG TPA: hypothetical protein VKX28_08390 [Xanthobacteraceae bacterium]|nr:hypothetical protein [Xanthobacteraceae bacterium]